MIAADPFAVPGCGSKIVRAGMSLQVSPLACGAAPGHSRIVWMPRKELFVSGTAQEVSCACAAATERRPTASKPKNFFMKNPPKRFARIIRQGSGDGDQGIGNRD